MAADNNREPPRTDEAVTSERDEESAGLLPLASDPHFRAAFAAFGPGAHRIPTSLLPRQAEARYQLLAPGREPEADA
jgi:hypothetical protein